MRCNVAVHEGVFSHQNNLIQEAESMLLHFTGGPRVQERNVHGGDEVPVSLKLLVFERFKMNWDVALDTKNKCIGVGVIVRDHKGLIQAALSKTINCLHP